MDFEQRVECEIDLAQSRHDWTVRCIEATPDDNIDELRRLDRRRRIHLDLAATLRHVSRMHASASKQRNRGRTSVAILVEKHPLVAPHVVDPSSMYRNCAYLRDGHTMTLRDLVTAWRDSLRDDMVTKPWLSSSVNKALDAEDIRAARVCSVSNKYDGNSYPRSLIASLSLVLDDAEGAKVRPELVEQVRLKAEREHAQKVARIRAKLNTATLAEHGGAAAAMLAA